MVEAYKTGELGGVFRPYIECKTGGSIFSKQQAYTMLDAASELLEQMFDDPEADAKLRSYLDGVKAYLAEDDMLYFLEPEIFATEEQSLAFCFDIGYGIDERTPIERYPLRSYEPADVPFIELIENY